MKITSFLVCSFLAISTSCLQAQGFEFKNIDFKKADSMAALYPKHSLHDLKLLTDKLTKLLPTDVEKFRAIYKWVCDNIENDYALYLKTARQREKTRNPEEFKAWNKKFTTSIFKELMNSRKTVCSGYAYLLKELAFHAGLTGVIINGYGRTAQANIRGQGVANHSWNAIQLNNKWFLCDATWSSGVIDVESSTFIKKYTDGYFLADPSLFIRNHYPLDSTWMLLDIKPTLHEFLNQPLIYSSIYRYQINQLFPETFDVTTTRGKTVSFQFAAKNTQDLEPVELLIKGPNGVHSYYPKLYTDPAGLYCIDQVFTSKGTYIVHVLLNHEYMFAYTIEAN